MSTLDAAALKAELDKNEEIQAQWRAWWSESVKESSKVEDTFYITTAINYTNGSPHIGHAYEAVCTDIIARYNRIYGRKTFFLTGSDEHGQKIAQTAEKEGITPIELCNRFAGEFQELNKRLVISNDRYIRTTNPDHYKIAQTVLQRAIDAGDVYLGKYNGWYNVKEETFVTETEAQLCDYKDPSTGIPFTKMEEESYFFKLSKFQERLVEHIKSNAGFIQPESQRQFILQRLEEPLQDLSISRTTFTWGIPFPSDARHVLYVWFDALTNYLTGVNWPSGPNSEYWPPQLQVVGKDITWFHTVIWPCMLFSADIPLPHAVFAHGFVNDADGSKMSKTKNNVISPHAVLDVYPVDSLRLFLIHESPFGGDLPFSEPSLVLTHNADLADTLGNLINRVTNITSKYSNSLIPDQKADHIFDFDAVRSGVEAKMAQYDLMGAYGVIIQVVKDINGYLHTKEPWKIKPADDPTNEKKHIILRSVLEACYIAAHFLAAFLPVTTAAIFTALNTPPRAISSLNAFENLTVNVEIAKNFSFKKLLLPGQEDAKKAPAVIAPKKKPQKNNNQQANKAEEQPLFSQLDLRVGEIVKVWKHPKSDKLWCEEINVGGETPLQVASGLQQVYTEEQMLGARVIVVNNLRPAKLADFMSHGMVLCAKTDSVTEFVTPPEGAKPGERIFIDGVPKELEPLSALQVRKKKVWEQVAVGLRTNSELQATFNGSPLKTSAGICTVVSAKDAPIS